MKKIKTPMTPTDSPLKAFGDMVRIERKKARLTQKELAAKAGITHEYVCKIEKGKVSAVSFNLISRMGAIFDKSINLVIEDNIS